MAVAASPGVLEIPDDQNEIYLNFLQESRPDDLTGLTRVLRDLDLNIVECSGVQIGRARGGFFRCSTSEVRDILTLRRGLEEFAVPSSSVCSRAGYPESTRPTSFDFTLSFADKPGMFYEIARVFEKNTAAIASYSGRRVLDQGECDSIMEIRVTIGSEAFNCARAVQRDLEDNGCTVAFVPAV